MNLAKNIWNNVETKPGPGYPRYWEDGSGGTDDEGNLKRDGLMPKKEDHGEEVLISEVYFKALKLGFNRKANDQRRQLG